MTAPPKVAHGALRSLLGELEIDVQTGDAALPAAASEVEPWRVEYNTYLDTAHVVPEGISLVQWCRAEIHSWIIYRS